MITRITEKNAQQYRILFNKAADYLREKKPDDMDQVIGDQAGAWFASWDKFSISSLNEYYAYLENFAKIIETEANDPDRDDPDFNDVKFFFRLPLDEDVFSIDANSRNITVPSSFARNGIGVQGDEMAEVLYFTIDRYFDAQDLADGNKHIAIQWETRNNKGFTKNFGKDTESIEGKVIFGWPITKEITENSGTIKFIVRIYSIKDDTLAYSFATLPAEVTINPTLVYDLENDDTEIDYGKTLLSRITSAGIHNSDMPVPKTPIITVADITGEDMFLYAEGQEYQKIVDLDNENKVVLITSAQPAKDSSGVLSYRWNKYPYQNGDYSNDSSTVSGSQIDFIQMTVNLHLDDNEKVDYDYYTYNPNENKYELFDNSQINSLNENVGKVYYQYEDDEQNVYSSTKPEGTTYTCVYKCGDNSYTPLFKKINKLVIEQEENDLPVTGKYTVDIEASILVNKKDKIMSVADSITIPGPRAPIVDFGSGFDVTEDDIKVAHIIAGNEDIVLSVTAAPGESASGLTVNDVGQYENKVDLTYAWKTKDANDTNYTEIGSVTANSLTIEATTATFVDNPNYDKTYIATVTSMRNKATTSADSGIFRITAAPQAPIIKMRKLVNVNGDTSISWVPVTNADAPVSAFLRNQNGNFSTTLTVNADETIKSDGLDYYWMKLTLEAEEKASGIAQIDITGDGEENSLPQELVDKLLALENASFTDVNGIPDLIATAFEGFSAIPETPSDTAEINYSGARNQNTLTISGTNKDDLTGIYYCIVINKLNNHINASASPFFIVQQ